MIISVSSLHVDFLHENKGSLLRTVVLTLKGARTSSVRSLDCMAFFMSPSLNSCCYGPSGYLHDLSKGLTFENILNSFCHMDVFK